MLRAVGFFSLPPAKPAVLFDEPRRVSARPARPARAGGSGGGGSFGGGGWGGGGGGGGGGGSGGDAFLLCAALLPPQRALAAAQNVRVAEASEPQLPASVSDGVRRAAAALFGARSRRLPYESR